MESISNKILYPYCHPEQILRTATDAFLMIPEKKDAEVRCHEVARIVRAILAERYAAHARGPEFVVCDGTYGPGVEHSWISVLNDSVEVGILDPYCVGRMPPVALIDVKTLTMVAHRELYRPGSTRTDIDVDFVEKTVADIKRYFKPFPTLY